jgi:hypothetical protein
MGKEFLTGWKDCGRSVQDYSNKEQSLLTAEHGFS